MVANTLKRHPWLTYGIADHVAREALTQLTQQDHIDKEVIIQIATKVQKIVKNASSKEVLTVIQDLIDELVKF